MATILKQARFGMAPDQAWALLRDTGNVHRLFPGVLVDSRLHGNSRIVTFANGMVVEERIVTIDDRNRRLVYTVVGPPPEHHNASMQILEDGAGGCHFVWITDVLPDEFSQVVEPLAEQGMAALATVLVARQERSRSCQPPREERRRM